METSHDYYTNQDKQKIIAYCIDHIKNGNEGGNGYCSLLYAAKQACPGKGFKDLRHSVSYLKSVASLITESGEYIISNNYRDGDGNVDIKKNPDYKKKKYFERHPTQEKIFIAVVSSVIGGCVTLAISTYNNRSQQKIDSKQDQEIKGLRDSFSKIQMTIKHANN